MKFSIMGHYTSCRMQIDHPYLHGYSYAFYSNLDMNIQTKYMCRAKTDKIICKVQSFIVLHNKATDRTNSCAALDPEKGCSP